MFKKWQRISDLTSFHFLIFSQSLTPTSDLHPIADLSPPRSYPRHPLVSLLP